MLKLPLKPLLAISRIGEDYLFSLFNIGIGIPLAIPLLMLESAKQSQQFLLSYLQTVLHHFQAFLKPPQHHNQSPKFIKI
jgi:hypothetical protein